MATTCRSSCGGPSFSRMRPTDGGVVPSRSFDVSLHPQVPDTLAKHPVEQWARCLLFQKQQVKKRGLFSRTPELLKVFRREFKPPFVRPEHRWVVPPVLQANYEALMEESSAPRVRRPGGRYGKRPRSALDSLNK